MGVEAEGSREGGPQILRLRPSGFAQDDMLECWLVVVVLVTGVTPNYDTFGE
ncbi:hypothetical protein JAO29_13980 [Edaphobacter sp. HDX4]